MYGTIVVHPQNEEPAKEFSVVFSEIYNAADPGVFNEVNDTGSFDIGKFLNQNPDLIITNGMSFKYAPSVGKQDKRVKIKKLKVQVMFYFTSLAWSSKDLIH